MIEKTTKITKLFMVLGLTFFFSYLASGQSTSWSISGTVKDSNGAAVPGVAVGLVNPADNFPQQTTTNEDGNFVYPQVKPGTYTITVEKTGFRKIEKNNVVLSTGGRLNAGDFTVEVGEVTNAVTVTADVAQLQIKTESEERSDIVTGRQIQDLALNGEIFQRF